MWTALRFLTTLPLPGREPPPQQVGRSLSFFPVVGLLIGLLLLGVDRLLSLAFPPLLSSAGVVVALLLITGGLHIDGFIDVCDGLAGGRTPGERLAVMKDARIGSFGAIGAFSLLLLKVLALASLEGPPRLFALPLMPALSRWGMVLVIAAYPYARPAGTGQVFKEAASRGLLAVATLFALAFSLGLLGLAGLALMAGMGLAGLAGGGFLSRRLGGLTGDGYGAINEVGELFFLLLSIPLLRLPTGGGLYLWLNFS